MKIYQVYYIELLRQTIFSTKDKIRIKQRNRNASIMKSIFLFSTLEISTDLIILLKSFVSVEKLITLWIMIVTFLIVLIYSTKALLKLPRETLSETVPILFTDLFPLNIQPLELKKKNSFVLQAEQGVIPFSQNDHLIFI